MATPFVQQASWARLVLDLSVVAFVVGEVVQAAKVRRGASRADLRGEVAFRAVFFAGILMLPLGRSLAPWADVAGAGIFVVGTLVGWSGLLLRWWSFATLGPLFTTVVRTSADQAVVSRGP